MSTQWKTRRLAARTVKVVERNAAHPPVAAFGATLVAKAQGFIAAYDEAPRLEAAWRQASSEQRAAMAELVFEVEAWKPSVARERPSFDVATVGVRRAVPEDLVTDAVALAGELEQIRGADGAMPAWAAAAAASIREKASRAERASDAAASGNAAFNTKLNLVRDAKEAFEGELMLFRRALRSVLGRGHPDYQKLRARKADNPDVDDDIVVPMPEQPVQP